MPPMTRQEFTSNYSPYINSITKGTGILPGTVIAQAILESSGNYNTGGQWLVGGSKLSQEANNYFGIKADSSWTGPTYTIKTTEYKGSTPYVTTASFRKYNGIRESIADYVKFLIGNPRYAQYGVFSADTVLEQAKRLKQAGYATAPDYATMVAGVYSGVKKWVSGYFEPITDEIFSAFPKNSSETSTKQDHNQTSLSTVLEITAIGIAAISISIILYTVLKKRLA